jgi:hypothetical protein
VRNFLNFDVPYLDNNLDLSRYSNMTGHDEYLERPEREDLRLGAPGEGCPAKAASDIMSWANRPNHLPALPSSSNCLP